MWRDFNYLDIQIVNTNFINIFACLPTFHCYFWILSVRDVPDQNHSSNCSSVVSSNIISLPPNIDLDCIILWLYNRLNAIFSERLMKGGGIQRGDYFRFLRFYGILSTFFSVHEIHSATFSKQNQNNDIC